MRVTQENRSRITMTSEVFSLTVTQQHSSRITMTSLVHSMTETQEHSSRITLTHVLSMTVTQWHWSRVSGSCHSRHEKGQQRLRQRCPPIEVGEIVVVLGEHRLCLGCQAPRSAGATSDSRPVWRDSLVETSLSTRAGTQDLTGRVRCTRTSSTSHSFPTRSLDCGFVSDPSLGWGLPSAISTRENPVNPAVTR